MEHRLLDIALFRVPEVCFLCGASEWSKILPSGFFMLMGLRYFDRVLSYLMIKKRGK